MKYSVKINEMPISLPDRTIYGRAYIPEGKDGKLKAVILSHGYNSSCDDLADVAHALAENGLFAYCYDFCGGSVRSKSSGSSKEMSVSTEICDLKEVLGYIRSLDNTDAENIYLYGESQGGFVTSLTADDTIKALFLLYPAFCIPDDWEKIAAKGMPEEMDFMGMTLTKCYYEGVPKFDVFEHIGHYGGSVSIYHGDADTVVALSYAQKAAASFPNASLTVFENEGHGFSGKARQQLIASICEKLSAEI